MPERRVLIVEDEEGIGLHLRFMLQRLGYEPLGPVTTGEAAVEQMAILRPDLVLMDIFLAGSMTGIEASARMQARRHLPVIFLSALSGKDIVNEAQQTDPYAYLVKPVSEPELRAAIELAFYKFDLESRLRESEARYRTLFTSLSTGFVLCRALFDEQDKVVDYELIDANPAFQYLVNDVDHSLIGMKLSQILTWVDITPYIEAYPQLAEPGKSMRFDLYQPVEQRYFELTAFSPRVGEVAVIVDEVTERRVAEEAIQESYRRTEFALRRMTVLRNIDMAITTHTDLQAMVVTVLEHLSTLNEVDASLLFYPETSGEGNLRLAGTAGVTPEMISAPGLVILRQEAERVYETGKTFYAGHIGDQNAGHAMSGAGSLTFVATLGYQSCAFLPLITKGQVKGVLLLMRRLPDGMDADLENFYQSLALQSAIAIDNVEMFQSLKKSHAELSKAYDATIQGWAQTMELRDKETLGHSERVVNLAETLARSLGMSEDEIVHFRRGVLLHDIGKLAVPDNILLKPDKLTSDEWVVMRQHTTHAYEMLERIEFLRPAIDVPFCHHEKWDGTGYPRKLKGEEIPLSARIFAIVDAWDALINTRPYRPAWSQQDAMEYILDQAGKQFDPQIVAAFVKIVCPVLI